ncbi:MAG: hypothetical protein J5905_06650 [Prevotella sp.]|nr:hypothetical protein [Prevotella sp.]
MQSYTKMVVCARKTGYLTFAEGQYFRGLRGGDAEAVLLDAEVMLLDAEVMLLYAEVILLRFWAKRAELAARFLTFLNINLITDYSITVS